VSSTGIRRFRVIFSVLSPPAAVTAAAVVLSLSSVTGVSSSPVTLVVVVQSFKLSAISLPATAIDRLTSIRSILAQGEKPSFGLVRFESGLDSRLYSPGLLAGTD
jgi:hypothetical protein